LRPIFHFASITALLLGCYYVVSVLIRPFESFFAQALSGPSIHDLRYCSYKFKLSTALLQNSLSLSAILLQNMRCLQEKENVEKLGCNFVFLISKCS